MPETDFRYVSQNNPNKWIGTPRTAQNVLPRTIAIDWLNPASGPVVGSLPTGGQKRFGDIYLSYEGAGNSVAGVGALYADQTWIAGQWTDATSTFTDDTTDAQDADTNDFQLFTTTNNDGFVIGCIVPFDIFSVDVTTANNAAGTIEYTYWGQPSTGIIGAAGWQTATGVIATGFGSTGESLFVGNQMKNLMDKAAVGDITGAPAGYFYLRVRATTAPATTAGKAARIYVGREVVRIPRMSANSRQQAVGGVGAVRTFPGTVGYQSFWETANAGNHMYMSYQ